MDREDKRKQGQTTKDEAIEVVGVACSDEKEERSNKNRKIGEERGQHLKTKFELKEMQRDARELVQE